MDITTLETCPFQGPLRVRALALPVESEPPRPGERGLPCPLCIEPDSSYLWTDEMWRVKTMEPTSLPGSLQLETREHYDSFGDLPNTCLSDLGKQLARLERAILSIGRVGRVHAMRWGDGIAHFHISVYARPYGQLQLRGTFLEVWEMLLPPVPAEVVQATAQILRARIAEEMNSEPPDQ